MGPGRGWACLRINDGRWNSGRKGEKKGKIEGEMREGGRKEKGREEKRKMGGKKMEERKERGKEWWKGSK